MQVSVLYHNLVSYALCSLENTPFTTSVLIDISHADDLLAEDEGNWTASCPSVTGDRIR